jgi:hypothetical protein
LIAPLTYIITTTVEEAVLVPLNNPILQLLNADSIEFKQEENDLLEKIKLLKLNSQDSWGVVNEFISPLQWQTAVFELSNLENYLCPSLQLNSLIRCCKAIFIEFKFVVLPIAKGIIIITILFLIINIYVFNF